MRWILAIWRRSGSREVGIRLAEFQGNSLHRLGGATGGHVLENADADAGRSTGFPKILVISIKFSAESVPGLTMTRQKAQRSPSPSVCVVYNLKQLPKLISLPDKSQKRRKLRNQGCATVGELLGQLFIH
jgi:hypothetical protein